ncbi:MAG: hypothetical protein M3306_00440 [Actinomycetota bacterium]|nr:hypothetical protein [Actinomycetota bacterium]
MRDDDEFVVFLDANVLAKPVTRTLVLRCATSGYTVAWSEHAETEASRHMGERQLSVQDLRALVGIELSGSGEGLDRFATSGAGDRQILADAEVAEATFLVTEDVDDFVDGDLALVGVSVVNPDLFLSERADEATYRRALEAMVSGMTNPARTPAQLHAAIARQHPRLFARHADLFDVKPETSGHSEPRILFRGETCLRCLMSRDASAIDARGVCADCRQRAESVSTIDVGG